MSTFAGRSMHGVPRHARRHAANPVLRVEGLVARPLALSPGDFAALLHVPYVGGLSCIEGGNVPQTDWTGVPLADLIALAQPRQDAQFIQVSAGPYTVPVALAEAAQVLLCDHLSGEPLRVEHGGPWRLVAPGRSYYTSAKWVDRLVVTAEMPDNSAERISQARARARSAHPC